jgi:hypothetical protein
MMTKSMCAFGVHHVDMQLMLTPCLFSHSPLYRKLGSTAHISSLPIPTLHTFYNLFAKTDPFVQPPSQPGPEVPVKRPASPSFEQQDGFDPDEWSNSWDQLSN